MEYGNDDRSGEITIRDDVKKSILDTGEIRKDFPILHQKTRNNSLVYLDNAATTQKPDQVINAVNTYYRKYNANVHRGIYALSEQATEAYESIRGKVAEFISSEESRSIIFTGGTTESLNLVASSWGRYNLKPGDEVLITEMEHHSNIIPWQLIVRDTGAVLKYIPINGDGTLDLTNPEKYFTHKTKVVALIHQSNVFGTVNPVENIIKLAHNVGAVTVVDAAQSIPNSKVDVQALGCDFLAFSGHKMLGPTGIGVLYGKPDLLESMEPYQGGGEMIKTVTMNKSTWNDIPWKFEAGTPHIAQVVGLGAAIDYLENIGMDKIHAFEHELTEYSMDVLREIPGIRIYGNAPLRGPIISFNVEGIHPHDMAQILDYEGIAIRAGHHCAQPIMDKLGVSSTVRASFYVYNTRNEIDHLAKCIRKTSAYFA